MTPELINAAFSGLVLVLGAFASLAATRTRKTTQSRKQYRALERRLLVALGHIFKLESDLAESGLPVPSRPDELEDEGEDESTIGLPPSPTPR